MGEWAATCYEEVSRAGLLQPCNKPAVAVRLDPTSGTQYPVCSFHTRANMVPLRDVNTTGLSLTDDQVLALAKLLNSLPTHTLSAPLVDDAEFIDLLAARATISIQADVVIHQSRSSRR